MNFCCLQEYGYDLSDFKSALDSTGCRRSSAGSCYAIEQLDDEFNSEITIKFVSCEFYIVSQISMINNRIQQMRLHSAFRHMSTVVQMLVQWYRVAG